MGRIVPTNREVLGLRGLHLYHFSMSNCSQKVRLCLTEKGLAWESAGLNRWSAALRARPSFQTAILDWEPQPIREFFAQYVESRRRDGTDVRAPVWCE